VTLSLINLKVNLLDILILYTRVIFLACFSFIVRFKGIIDELFRELNKEHLKIFNSI
jgi:hypothetical protein